MTDIGRSGAAGTDLLQAATPAQSVIRNRDGWLRALEQARAKLDVRATGGETRAMDSGGGTLAPPEGQPAAQYRTDPDASREPRDTERSGRGAGEGPPRAMTEAPPASRRAAGPGLSPAYGLAEAPLQAAADEAARARALAVWANEVRRRYAPHSLHAEFSENQAITVWIRDAGMDDTRVQALAGEVLAALRSHGVVANGCRVYLNGSLVYPALPEPS